ncbi:MAG: hypothetical protein H6718_31845 [Polyangiaceae bacterium]|nr:hypothetical protein [Myxococcales bacterium]MCB9590051.1 hypothetical protein [Polyangiaceae bacterium]
MSGFRIGLSLARTRLTSWGSLGVLALGLLIAGLGSVLFRSQPEGLDLSLLGLAFGLIMPFGALSLSRRAFGSGSLLESVAEPARWGADRRGTLLGLWCGLSLTLLVWFALLALETVLLGGGTGGDALRSAGVGVEAGIAYASYLTAASGFGRHGHARVWFIGADWLLGATTGALALPFPRAHIANLLGSTPPANLPQLGSGLVLACCCLVCLGMTRVRVPS